VAATPACGLYLWNALRYRSDYTGPVSITTNGVIPYCRAGLPGAFAATFRHFPPSFVLVILTAPFDPKMRRSRFVDALLDVSA